MTTVINNPGNNSEESGMGLVVGVIVAIVIIALFFIYVLPTMRDGADQNNNDQNPGSIDVNVTLPTGDNNPPPAGADSPIY